MTFVLLAGTGKFTSCGRLPIVDGRSIYLRNWLWARYMAERDCLSRVRLMGVVLTTIITLLNCADWMLKIQAMAEVTGIV